MKDDLKNLFLKASRKALDAAGDITKEVAEDVVRMAAGKITEMTEKSKQTISDKEEINRIIRRIKKRKC